MPTSSGASSRGTGRSSCARTRRRSTGSSITRCATTTTSSSRRSASARPTRSSARRSTRSTRRWPRLPSDADAETIQTALYDVGRAFERYQTKDKPGPDGRPGVALTWFSTLYELLLGPGAGPALRLLRGDLRNSGDAGADRQGAFGGARSVAGRQLRRLTARPAVAPEPELRRARRFSASASASPSGSAQPCATSHSAMSSSATKHRAGSGMASAPAGTAHSMARPRMKRRSAARAMLPQGQVPGSAPQRSSASGAATPARRITRAPDIDHAGGFDDGIEETLAPLRRCRGRLPRSLWVPRARAGR